jgi:hypothetical protein
VSVGGTDETNVAFGFGVHAGPILVDVVTDNLDYILSPKGSSFGSFSAGLSIRL